MRLVRLMFFVVGTALLFKGMALLQWPAFMFEPPRSEREWIPRALGSILFYVLFVVIGLLCISGRKKTVQSAQMTDDPVQRSKEFNS